MIKVSLYKKGMTILYENLSNKIIYKRAASNG